MTPAQFLAQVRRGAIAPAYLFLGAETYDRWRCRTALLTAFLAEEQRESGVIRYDMNETSLSEVIDEARLLSLFDPRRVIVICNAEAALPRQASEDEEGQAGGSGEALAQYLKNPSPEVVLLFEATRYDFEGEDKKKLERVRVFYSAVPGVVELQHYSTDEAHAEARDLARRAGTALEPAALELLVESLGADMARIAVEIEKLSLYAGGRGIISVNDVAALAPNARVSTIFALVNALGRRDRKRSLHILDTLIREGEYLPLALSFLATQFRLALISNETGLRSVQQIQAHFSKSGVPMWRSRAEQVYETVSKFSKEQIERAIKLIFQADTALRSARPDDRTVMEQFVLRLTA